MAEDKNIFKKAMYLAGSLWSVLVVCLFSFEYYEHRLEVLEMARMEARTAFEKDVLYRRWNAMHGGVYASATDKTQPNPYLSHIPERDITTPSGKRLTLVNPAYMTRQVHEIGSADKGMLGHITSLKPLRPENAPDVWETKALTAFERGAQEFSGEEKLRGSDYMRLMRPLKTEAPCLKCHAGQGYKLGDIRGGISISVPLEPFLSAHLNTMKGNLTTYGILWFAVLGIIVFGTKKLIAKTDKIVQEEARYHSLFNTAQEERRIAQLYLDTAGVMLCALDSEGVVTLINRKGCEILGCEAEEIIGKNWFDHFLPGRLRLEVKGVFLMLMSGDVKPVEYYENPLLTKNGEEKIIAFHNTVLTDTDGRITGVLFSGEDITEHKKADDELRRAKEEWENTFDAITDPIMLLDNNYKIIRANKATAQKLGVSAEETVGLTCYEHVHGTSEPPPDCPHSRLLADGKSHSTEILEPRLGGYFLVTVSPNYSDSGELCGSIHSARDITDLKLAEETLRKSEKRIRDITSALGEGLYVLDDMGALLFMNPEAEKMLGWTENELRNRNIHDTVHFMNPDGSVLPFEDCPMHNVITTGKSYTSRDQVFVRKNGAAFPVSILSTPLLEDGKITGSVTAFRDITERLQIDREREKLIDELQKALTEIKTLRGILPICSYCKKIRDDKGAWKQLESYISDHTDAMFSHGICLDCAARMYPDYFKKKNEEKKQTDSD